MPKVTLIEADNLMWAIGERIETFRVIERQIITPKTFEKIETEIDSAPIATSEGVENKEVIETEKIEVKHEGLGYTLEQIHSEIDKLLLKKSRIEAAMWAVKSTYKFEV